jgi:hypothetical protein
MEEVMRTSLKIISGLFIASLLITGCGLMGGNSAASQTAEQTIVASTVMALQTALAANNTAVATAAATTAVTPTAETLPTFTQAAQVLPTSAAPAAPTATSQPAYLVTNVEDITAPDNTVFKPGETFTKTWRITNGGGTTWASTFKLVYVSGDQMGATAVTLGRSVTPNDTIDVSVSLTAPSTAGTYQGNFMIQTSSGNNFGLGTSASSAFWVKIIVQDFFQVSGATVVASPTSFSGSCPSTVSLKASITTTAAGTVTYYFVTSTGNSSTYTMTFSSGTTITSSAITWPVTSSTPLVVHIYIDTPNHQDFPEISIPVTCS